MRRAEARRSASVMVSNSITWLLCGKDVDWMVEKYERRTMAMVGGSCSQLAISCASAGLELQATSLMEPFLADIEASPRALLVTVFSISGYPWNRRVTTCEGIS